MDANRFDALTRTLTAAGSRRRALRGLAAVAVVAVAARLGSGETAANHTGCGHTGTGCRRGGHCCSGVCKGSRGKKTCRCPQRVCCQCALPPVGEADCGFLAAGQTCDQRCAALGGIPVSSIAPGAGHTSTCSATGQCSVVPCSG